MFRMSLNKNPNIMRKRISMAKKKKIKNKIMMIRILKKKTKTKNSIRTIMKMRKKMSYIKKIRNLLVHPMKERSKMRTNKSYSIMK